VFVGTHTPRLDDKGRLLVPSRYREALAGGFYLTRGQGPCLHAYPRVDFERRYAELRAATATNPAVREYLRVMLAGASEEELDKQGRFTVPPVLRTFAGLDREVAVVGAGERLEVWDEASWRERFAQAEAGYDLVTLDDLPGLL
jgi:MraZ protein